MLTFGQNVLDSHLRTSHREHFAHVARCAGIATMTAATAAAAMAMMLVMMMMMMVARRFQFLVLLELGEDFLHDDERSDQQLRFV